MRDYRDYLLVELIYILGYNSSVGLNYQVVNFMCALCVWLHIIIMLDHDIVHVPSFNRPTCIGQRTLRRDSNPR
eukprot:SAG31_NODE_554_length_14181_cov_22.378000_2_plen_74_part_00